MCSLADLFRLGPLIVEHDADDDNDVPDDTLASCDVTFTLTGIKQSEAVEREDSATPASFASDDDVGSPGRRRANLSSLYAILPFRHHPRD